jgi:uncharacterized protein (TIGR02444 family)
MSAASPIGFWPFSVNAFGQPEIERLCLALQDQHDLDVNLLLFCCWLGLQESAVLTAAQVQTLIDATDEWQAEIVKPLRAIRRRLKQQTGGVSPQQSLALHRAVAGIELESEQLEQTTILQQAITYETSSLPTEQQAVANLQCYSDTAGVNPTDSLNAKLEKLVALLVAHARQRSNQA